MNKQYNIFGGASIEHKFMNQFLDAKESMFRAESQTEVLEHYKQACDIIHYAYGFGIIDTATYSSMLIDINDVMWLITK